MMSETQRRPTKKSHLEVTHDSEDEPYKEVEKKVDLNEIEPILTQNQMQHLDVVPGLKLWQQDPHVARKQMNKRESTMLSDKKSTLTKRSFFNENDPSMRLTKQGMSITENSLELRKKHSRVTYGNLIEAQGHQASQKIDEVDQINQ